MLLIINEFSLSFRQWYSGVLPLLPLIFIFVICTIFFEAHCYHVNKEKVKLFLEMETSKRQEKQTYAILHNIPTNVIVLYDSNVIFKNRNAESLILSLSQEQEGFSEEADFDLDRFFLNTQMFKAKLQSDQTPARRKIFKRMCLSSLLQVVASDQLLKVSERFVVKLRDGKKRSFTFNKELVELSDRSCVMLVVSE
jgi:hypothetical protein